MIFLSEGIPSLDQATRVAKVRIEANDAPHGVVEFAQSSYNASEGSTTYLLVLRQFGTAGDIRVFYRFAHFDTSFHSAAESGRSFCLSTIFRSQKLFSLIDCCTQWLRSK